MTCVLCCLASPESEQQERLCALSTSAEEGEARARQGLAALEQVLRAETAQRLQAQDQAKQWQEEVSRALQQSIRST